MGAVTFGLDERLVERLSGSSPFDVLVETGTYRGDTVHSMLPYFDRILSVELSESLWAEADARFRNVDAVDIVHGDSAEVLRQRCPGIRDQAVFYWLDAHWCVAEGSAGTESQCALLAELEAIDSINERSVVVIDDARLFLTIPPPPHEVSQWPCLTEVIQRLRALSTQHELMVVNDVIICFPSTMAGQVADFARSHGVDWLAAYQAYSDGSDGGNLTTQLEEKEKVIRELSSALTWQREQVDSRQRSIEDLRSASQELHATAEERLNKMRELNTQLAGKEEVIRHLSQALTAYRMAFTVLQRSIEDLRSASQELHATAEERLDKMRELNTQLAGKEEVIRHLSQALTAYRVAFTVLRPILYPVRILRGVARRLLVPRLGRLMHYPPRPIRRIVQHECSVPAHILPTISVVTPSFQQGAFLERTISSVLEQEYPQLEYFIQDGGSTDGTLAVIKEYAARLTGWESCRDNGQSHALNVGFARTNGEIMGWLNSDDLFLPGALQYVGEYFAQHPEVDVVYGNRLLIDDNDQEIGCWVLPPHSDGVLAWADYVPQETLFWRREIWERAGSKVDESFKFAMDWDLLLRFRQAGARMVRLPHFLGAFRVHEAQKTVANMEDVGLVEMERLRVRTHGRPVNDQERRRALLPYIAQHMLYDLGYALRERLRVNAGR